MLVIFQHVTYYACETRGIPYQPFLPINFGRAGVDLFFVISGFVMGQCLSQGGAFIVHRAARILPPYWIAIAISFAVLGTSVGAWHFDFWSALLLPATDLNNSYMIPYWTLCYEAAFYIATYAIILTKIPRSTIPWVCVAWIAAIALFNIYRPLGNFDDAVANSFIFQPGWLILLSPVTMLFAFGLLIATAPAIPSFSVPPVYLLLLSVGLFAVGTSDQFATAVPNYIMLGFSYSIALVAFMRMPFPDLVSRLGDYSYGMYLIHVVAITAVMRAFKVADPTARLSIIWPTMMIAALVAGTAFGWFEYQLHTKVFKRGPQRNRSLPQAA